MKKVETRPVRTISPVHARHQKLTITILVPCYNEEKTIGKCVESWLNQSHKADKILIIDDCSTDNTLKVLEQFGDKITVVKLPKNTGNKSFVQEEGLKHIETDIFIATDADTLMDHNFVKHVYNAFTKHKDIAAFAGYIKSLKCNWLTSCREIDYTIGQDLHKMAQHNIGFLFVIPGCAGAFKTSLFKKIVAFEHDTLTEDLDFTYKFNSMGYRIFYDRNAVVYTQDPSTLKSYINQMRRWFSGGYQNLLKHRKLIQKPNIALELALMYVEGLTFSLLLLLVPILNLHAASMILGLYLIYNILTGIYAGVKRKRLDLVLCSPLNILLNYINAYIFLEQFVKEIVLRKKNLTWFHPERRVI